ncbi:MAG TPA: metalloregulator ArsR/SmtB family transcription factor [Acidimicrobiia bacterium]|nr:metalloregulator ArsR/SmtB family transcription factor [Acidimicrobiia bacterium]
MVSEKLQALAVPTRREIYAILISGRHAVGEIAARLPVSRPAVSQHLKVLVDAGLVESAAEGNRHYYTARPEGLAVLREWTDQIWDQAMSRFADFADREEKRMQDRIDPVVKRITVPGDVADVFELFTERIGEWWPMASHSVAGDEVVDVRIDPIVGGRMYEVTGEGDQHEWGLVLQWEQDRRLVLDWYPGLSIAETTRLELSFLPMGDRTEVTLIHDGWEARGEEALQRRDEYNSGWGVVLACLPGVGSAEAVETIARVG